MTWRDGWHWLAACARADVAQFFELGSPKARREAKAVCGGCPVRQQCLDSAMREERARNDREKPSHNLTRRHGMRGGLMPRERWALEYPEEAGESAA